MKTLLFLLKTSKINTLFVVMLFFTLSLTTSCYQDDDNSATLQRLSIDNVQKLATRNFEIYKFSDSVMNVYRKIQYEYPYNESSLTLALSTGKRNSATKVMDSLVYLLDSITTNALHRYTKNKEAYDYSQRTSFLPKGYVVDEKFTLEYLDTVYLSLSKLLNYHLPSIKKEAANFSDVAYRKLSLWYLELEQYLAKVKMLNAQFAETITPNKFTTKIFGTTPNLKTAYEFLLPFQRDSVKKINDIESDMFAVDFYLRNKSFPLGKDTTKILKVTKRLTSQADTFMFVVKFCSTLLQYEEYTTKGTAIRTDLGKLETLIKGNFPTMLIGGKSAVTEIGSAITKFDTETHVTQNLNHASLITKIIAANTANFTTSGNIASVVSLPSDYAEQKLKVLSDLKTQVEKQIEIEIAKSKDWVKERVDLLSTLITKEEALRDKITITPYQSQTRPIILTITTPQTLVSLNKYCEDIITSMNSRITDQKKLKTELTNYYQCTTCEPKNLAKIISVGAIDTLTQQLKGAEVTFEMAWLLDSVLVYYYKVDDRIASINSASTTTALSIKLQEFQSKLLGYAPRLGAVITNYYQKTPPLYYNVPNPIFNEFKDIRQLLKDIDSPETQVTAFDPATALGESGNLRKFIYNVSTVNGQKEMLAINKGTDTDPSLNFLSIPISHLSETIPILTNQTASQVISSLQNIKVEIGDIGTNTLTKDQFAVCLNITLSSGYLIQIPLLPTTSNKYVLVPLDDNINNNSNTFWDYAYRDYPNIQLSGVYHAYKGNDVLSYLSNNLSSTTTKHVKISIYHKFYWVVADENYGDNVQSIKLRGIFN